MMMALMRRWAAAGCLFLLVSFASSLSTPKACMPAEINIPAPPGLEYFGFQKEAIAALVNREDGLLLCDEMGLGKSISTIGALNLLGDYEKVLIIAPKSLLSMWEAELERWLMDEHKTIGIATAQGGIPDCNILLMNYDIVSKYKEEVDALGPWDVLVSDEAHYLKSAEAVRTMAILGDTKRRNNGAIQAKRKWLLTGSPLLNTPMELFPLLSALDPYGKIVPQIRDFETFCDHYCIRKDTLWGVTYKGGRNLPELRERLRSGDMPLMLRRTKNDVLKDLPEKRHQLLPLEDDVVAIQEEQTLKDALGASRSDTAVTDNGLASLKVKDLKYSLHARGLPTTGRKAELVERLRQHSVASSRARLVADETDEVSGDDAKEVFDSVGSALRSETGGRKWDGLQNLFMKQSSTVMGILATARHATALEKVPYAIEIIENTIDSQKMVVFAHHRDVQDALAEAFEDRVVVLHGGSTANERAEAVERFQQDDSMRLFVGSIRAAGVGITLTAASHVLFVEFDWSPSIVNQAEDRCHRVGQRSSVLVQYLYFRGTIDEHLASLLSSKQSTITAALDAPTGAASWTFDFGKHKGETVADVVASDSGYLKWIVEERAYVNRKELCKALDELGFVVSTKDLLPDKIDNIVDKLEETPRKVLRKVQTPLADSNHGDFVMPFGKHKGKRLTDIPKSYRGWLISSGAARSNFRLSTALNSMEASSPINNDSD